MGFAVVFGFLVAAACGYMAGLVGSSSSPISGIAILATILTSLILLGLFSGGGGMLGDHAGRQAAIAFVLFTVSAVLATATVSNDNLQDLKTGYLVGRRPGSRQAGAGCRLHRRRAGDTADPGPALQRLRLPRALPMRGWTRTRALAAPQAVLMSKIATGILATRWNGVSC